MQHAIMYDEQTNKASTLDAGTLHTRVQTDKDYLKQKRFFSPVRGVPVIPHFPRTARGNEIKIRAHFACAAGHGLSAHIFDRKKTADTISRAIDSGKKILLSLNTDLSFKDLNFRKTQNLQAQDKEKPLEQWITQNYNNYLSVSVTSLEDTIRALRHIHKYSPDSLKNGDVLALYQGGVMPYKDFYLGRDLSKLKTLYNNLAAGTEDCKIGQTRILGFPRLFHFTPSQSTLNEAGMRGIKGNHLRPAHSDDSILFSKLVFADKNIQDTASYTALWNQLAAANDNAQFDGVYVMAAPSISVNPDTASDRKNWAMLRWIITDIDKQICKPGLSACKPSPKP